MQLTSNMTQYGYNLAGWILKTNRCALSDSVEVNDLAHDFFVILLSYPDSIDPGLAIKMARYDLFDLLRTKKYFFTIADRNRAEGDPRDKVILVGDACGFWRKEAESAVDKMINRISAKQAVSYLKYIPRHQREIVVKYYLKGMSGKDIAAEYGVTPSAIRHAIGKGLKILQRHVLQGE